MVMGRLGGGKLGLRGADKELGHMGPGHGAEVGNVTTVDMELKEREELGQKQ